VGMGSVHPAVGPPGPRTYVRSDVAGPTVEILENDNEHDVVFLLTRFCDANTRTVVYVRRAAVYRYDTMDRVILRSQSRERAQLLHTVRTVRVPYCTYNSITICPCACPCAEQMRRGQNL